MTTIETVSPRVSIVDAFGRINVRVEHSNTYAVMILCGAFGLDESMETARKVARREEWKLSITDWQKKAHQAVVDAERDTCEACGYRNTTGCLSEKCPVFRVLDCVNKAPAIVKRTAKSL